MKLNSYIASQIVTVVNPPSCTAALVGRITYTVTEVNNLHAHMEIS